MTYLRDYTHDVFISYGHGPEPFGGYNGKRTDFLRQWTRAFVDALTSELDIILGTKDKNRRVAVWMDPALEGNKSLSANLQSHVRSSALLLVVVSKFYLESDWCGQELATFVERQSGASSERIFVVKAYNTAFDQWPAGLKPGGNALPGYTFYRTEDPNELGTPLGWPLPDETEKDYWQQLHKLANEIAAQLKRLEWAQNQQSAAAAKKIPVGVGRRLFLGYMHDSLQEVRTDLRGRLDAAGFTVVPPVEDDPVDESTLKESFEKYLPTSDAIVLVANQNSELWPRGQAGGPLGLQLLLSQQRRIPTQLWLQAGDLAAVKNQQYRSFLANLKAGARGDADNVIEPKSIEEFVVNIRRHLDTAVKPKLGAEQFAVVCSNVRAGQPLYEDFQNLVIAALAEKDRSSIIADQDDESGQIRLTTLQDEITRADTLVVLCFDQEWKWANKIILQLRQIVGEQSETAKIFVMGPEYRNKGKFVSAFKFKTVLGVSADNVVNRDEVADQIRRTLS